MSQSTDNKTRGVLAILAALSSRGATGTLRFQADSDSKDWIEFLFRQGHLLYATSNRKGERLGEFLVRREVLSKEKALEILREANRRKQLFHAHLVELGLIQLDKLKDLLFQRAEELLDAIIHSDNGRFVFLPNYPPEIQSTLGLWIDSELFARLLKRRDVWPRVYDKFRDQKLVLQLGATLRQPGALERFNPPQRRLLELLDGERPVSEILAGRKNRLDLMIALERFLEKGVIEVRQQKRVKPTSPGQAPIHPAPSASVDKYDLDLVPSLASGTSLDKISITGLMMDDLYLVSQLDGRMSIRELLIVTGLTENQVSQVLNRLSKRGYVKFARTRVAGPEGEAAPSKAGKQSPAAPEAGSSGKRRSFSSAPGPRWDPSAPGATLGPKATDLYERALRAYSARQTGDALKLLRRAMQRVGTHPPLRSRIAVCLLDFPGQQEQALHEARLAYERAPQERMCLEAMGYAYLRKGDLDTARRFLKQAILRDNNNKISSAGRVFSKIQHHSSVNEPSESMWESIRPLIGLSK